MSYYNAAPLPISSNKGHVYSQADEYKFQDIPPMEVKSDVPPFFATFTKHPFLSTAALGTGSALSYGMYKAFVSPSRGASNMMMKWRVGLQFAAISALVGSLFFAMRKETK
jgi:hypothetical protein|eukprot:TRINITY_DN30845_c0_g1_i1.p1 TRINITY_DN30845_c0_g1~~TRINITY_DN30845_c0_g1_i1.p1  ORF type:complete len:111 (+),score=3.35 TRINITY_DN30845_c0_g1_i1:189-521(+)